MDRPRSSSVTGLLEGIEGWLPAEAFQDSDEDATDMLDEALVRGEMAQRRRRLRRRLVSRPRDVLDTLPDEGSVIRDETYGHAASGSAEQQSDYDSSPDPLLRRPTIRMASIPRAESIFFPPSPDRNRQAPASRPSAYNLASRQARHSASNPQQPRPVTLKPVLLLYCAAPPSADIRRPSSRDSLPPDFFYVDDGPDNPPDPTCIQQNTSSLRKTYSPVPEANSGGGGCGVLICARAHTASGLDVFASQTPPPTSTVDWLEPLSDSEEALYESDRMRLGLTCSCKKAYLGCRVCGNLVGRATVTACHRCKRSNNDSQPTKWTFFTSAVICAARKEGQAPAPQISPDLATPLAASSSTGRVMRWELGSVPFLDDDIKHGLAGDIDEWARRAKTLFRPSLDQPVLRDAESSSTGFVTSQRPRPHHRPWRAPEVVAHPYSDQGLQDPWPSFPAADSLAADQDHSEGGSRPQRTYRTSSIQPTFRFSALQDDEANNDEAEPGDTLRRIRGLRQSLRQPQSEAGRTWTWASGPPSAGSGTGANAVELPHLDGEESEVAVTERPLRRRRRRSSSTIEGPASGIYGMPSDVQGGRATRQRVDSRSESGSWQAIIYNSQPEAPVGR